MKFEKYLQRKIIEEMIEIVYKLKEYGKDVTLDAVKSLLVDKEKYLNLIDTENYDEFVRFNFINTSCMDVPVKKNSGIERKKSFGVCANFNFINPDILHFYNDILKKYEKENGGFAIEISPAMLLDEDKAKKHAIELKVQLKKDVINRTNLIRSTYTSSLDFIDKDFNYIVNFIDS